MTIRSVMLWSLAALAPVSAAWAEGYSVRLAVSSGRKSIRVSADGLVVKDGDVGDVLLEGHAGPLPIVSGDEGLRLPGVEVKPRSVLLEAEGHVRVGKRRLVGRVEVYSRPAGLLVVNRLGLERYLTGMLAAEMSASWPLEALRAQAVASRTYAVRRCLDRQEDEYDLSVSVLDQVYKGIDEEAERTRKAVASTAGEVLTYRGVPAEALFHSCCGGRTRSAEQVFGNAVDYLVAVEDPDCKDCPKHEWRVELTPRELASRLAAGSRGIGNLRTVEKVRVGKGRHVIALRGGKGSLLRLSGHRLRMLIGPDVLPSGEFDIEQGKGCVVFKGHGSGHGVGMCQWGARGKALRGENYRSILAHYFPGTRLSAMY